MSRRISFSIALALLCIVIILFTACQEDGKTKIPDGNPKASKESVLTQEEATFSASGKLNIISDDRLNSKQWNQINKYAQLVGKTMFEIVENVDSFSYYWNENGTQHFEVDDQNDLLFSNQAWNGIGTCSAIAISGYNVLSSKWGGTEADLKNCFGEGYSYHKGGAGCKRQLHPDLI